MDITIRAAAEADWPAIARRDGEAFGFRYTDEQLADNRLILELDRFTVADDGGDVVGVAGAFSFAVTLPGAAEVPAGGLTWVSVATTHRRRGILRALVAAQLAQHIERGDALSLLYASQGGIYGRFGYGPATAARRVSIAPRSVHLRAEVGQSPVRLVDTEEARRLVPALWDQHRATQPGALSRRDAWWDYLFLDRELWRNGASARFWLAHAEGFASYRVEDRWDDGRPNFLVYVLDVAAATPGAHAALWRYLLAIDLAGEVQYRSLAQDDPLPWLIDDPRQVRTTSMNDGMWARVIDTGRTLGSRRYGADDTLVVELLDDLVPTAAGRWRVEGGPDGATCTRVGSPPDLVLGPAALGAIVLGGHRPSTLARAGLVDELTPGVLRRADAFFAAECLPNNSTMF